MACLEDYGMDGYTIANVILVDMDGVFADFDGRFVDIWSREFPQRLPLRQDHRTSVRIMDEFPADYHGDIQRIYERPGFYLQMDPVPGALEAMKDMLGAGLDVWICTSPLMAYQHCIPEKYAWVDKHLGPDWVARMVLTRNKGLVGGRYLIDDLPEVRGHEFATWEHLLFDAPCNRNREHPKRVTWETWREFISLT